MLRGSGVIGVDLANGGSHSTAISSNRMGERHRPVKPTATANAAAITSNTASTVGGAPGGGAARVDDIVLGNRVEKPSGRVGPTATLSHTARRHVGTSPVKVRLHAVQRPQWSAVVHACCNIQMRTHTQE